MKILLFCSFIDNDYKQCLKSELRHLNSCSELEKKAGCIVPLPNLGLSIIEDNEKSFKVLFSSNSKFDIKMKMSSYYYPVIYAVNKLTEEVIAEFYIQTYIERYGLDTFEISCF